MKKALCLFLSILISVSTPAPTSLGPSTHSLGHDRVIANTNNETLFFSSSLLASVLERLHLNTEISATSGSQKVQLSQYDIDRLSADIQKLRTELQNGLDQYLNSHFASIDTEETTSEDEKTAAAFAQLLLYYDIAKSFESAKSQAQILTSPESWLSSHSIEINLMTSLNYFTFVGKILSIAMQPESPFEAQPVESENGWRLVISLNPDLYEEMMDQFLAARFADDVVAYSKYLLLKSQYQNLARVNGLLRRSALDLPELASIPAFQQALEEVPELAFLKTDLKRKELLAVRGHLAKNWTSAQIKAQMTLGQRYLSDKEANQYLSVLNLTSTVDRESQIVAIQDLVEANMSHVLDAEFLLLSQYRGPWAIDKLASLASLSRHIIMMGTLMRQMSIFKSLDPGIHSAELLRMKTALNSTFETARIRFAEQTANHPSLSQLAQVQQRSGTLSYLTASKSAFISQVDSDIKSIQSLTEDASLPIDMSLLAEIFSSDLELSGYHARWFNQLLRENDYATSVVNYHQFVRDNLEAFGHTISAEHPLPVSPQETYEAYFRNLAQSQKLTLDQLDEMLALLNAGETFQFFHSNYIQNPDDIATLINMTVRDLNLSSSDLKKYQSRYAERAAALNHVLLMTVSEPGALDKCHASHPDLFDQNQPLWKSWSHYSTPSLRACALDQHFLQMEQNIYATFNNLEATTPGRVSSALNWFGRQFNAQTQDSDSVAQTVIEMLALSSLYTASLQSYSFFDLEVRSLIENQEQAPPARALFDKFYDEILHPVFWGLLFYQITKFGLRFAAPNFHSSLNQFEKQLLTPLFGSRYQMASAVLMMTVLGYLGLEVKDTLEEARMERDLRAYHFSAFDDSTSFTRTENWLNQRAEHRQARNTLILTGTLLAGFMVGIPIARGLFRSYMRNYARSGAFVHNYKRFIEEGLGFQRGQWSLSREHMEGSLRAQVQKIRTSPNLTLAEKERLVTQLHVKFVKMERDLESLGRTFVHPPPHLTRIVHELGIMNPSVVGQQSSWWAHESRILAARSFWESQYKSGQISFAQWQFKKSQLQDVMSHAQAQVHWYKNSQEALEAARQGVARARPQNSSISDFLSTHNEFRWTSGSAPQWETIRNQNNWLDFMDASFRWKIITQGSRWRLEAVDVDHKVPTVRIGQEVRRLIENKSIPRRADQDLGWRNL